jgi:hypothetical protein
MSFRFSFSDGGRSAVEEIGPSSKILGGKTLRSAGIDLLKTLEDTTEGIWADAINDTQNQHRAI